MTATDSDRKDAHTKLRSVLDWHRPPLVDSS
jgi:hypothetical protein